MLFYFSSYDNEFLFEPFLEGRGIFYDFVPLEETPSLKTALAKNKAMPNYSYVLFHFTEPPLPEEDLILAVKYLRQFHHARVIVFAPEGSETSVLFGRLFDLGVRELVTVSGDTNLLFELAECFSPDGKSYTGVSYVASDAQIEEARARVRPAIVIPEGFTLTVGVAGAQARVGTTTQAIGLYHALKAVGFTPCLVDREQSLVSALMRLYGEDAAQGEDTVSICGVEFSHDILSGTEHNAFIADCGLLEESSAAAFGENALRFLCAGAKAWELPHLANAMQSHMPLIGQVIFSFASEREREQSAALLEGTVPAVYAPWQPDIWAAHNREWYGGFLVPLLQELTGP